MSVPSNHSLFPSASVTYFWPQEVLAFLLLSKDEVVTERERVRLFLDVKCETVAL